MQRKGCFLVPIDAVSPRRAPIDDDARETAVEQAPWQ